MASGGLDASPGVENLRLMTKSYNKHCTGLAWLTGESNVAASSWSRVISWRTELHSTRYPT